MTKAVKTVLSHLTILVICSLRKKLTTLDLHVVIKILGSNTLSKVPLSTFVKDQYLKITLFGDPSVM